MTFLTFFLGYLIQGLIYLFLILAYFVAFMIGQFIILIREISSPLNWKSFSNERFAPR
jgi:hypothetical protein